ncbi:MAG TPA: P-loop NTPase [Thermoanaerobaculia bacterium]|nr:P-loop NTPase [Thermoanaerobaculia bacterium]
MAIRRIIPISSGKGGVGKTTFAVNFALALSQHGRTILIDLDTGTSSVRNAIDVPVPRDLYHFFRRGEPLGNCITPLDDHLDPERRFRNFGFVAAPLHLIEEITNFGPEKKDQIIDAINTLDAEWIVLDMKAGLDSNVLDFLPWSNSGILLFTPHMPAATLAASDIVKAIIFRKLRLLFSPGSPFFELIDDSLDFPTLVNDLIDKAEDSYDESIPNLDAFANDLHASLGDHSVARTILDILHYFKVHYVLNLFNGVEDSFETAVRPFVENLTVNVTDRCTVTNLGWINRSDAIHQANCRRIPALLMTEQRPEKKVSRIEQELEDLRVTAIGLEPKRRKQERPRTLYEPISDSTDHLEEQLRVLRQMFEARGQDDYRANFGYMAQRALFTMKSRPATDFGESRIFRPYEALKQLLAETRRNLS